MNVTTPKHLFALDPAELSAYIDSRIPEGEVRDQIYRIVYFDVVSLKWKEIKDMPLAWSEWIENHLGFNEGERPEASEMVPELIRLGWSPVDALNRIVGVAL